MLPNTPELETLKARVKAIIAGGSDGYFDDPKESENLPITVRIACEFRMRLSNDAPDLEEADYMGRNDSLWIGLVLLDGPNRQNSYRIGIAVRVRSRIAKQVLDTKDFL